MATFWFWRRKLFQKPKDGLQILLRLNLPNRLKNWLRWLLRTHDLWSWCFKRVKPFCECDPVLSSQNTGMGFICANAGIDHSNVQSLGGKPENWVLLLPQDADESARKLRIDLEKRYGVQLGVLIIDSHGRAWRMGTIGMTIGLSGFPCAC